MLRAGAGLTGSLSLKGKLNGLGEKKRGPDVKVGIVKTARYPSEQMKGRPGAATRKNPPFVAQVAFWNEFGTRDGNQMFKKGIPPRPFMRNAVKEYLSSMEIKFLLHQHLNAEDPVLTVKAAKLLGALMAGIMQKGMRNPTFAPNTDLTKKIKKSATPLIDTGLLRRSVSFEVEIPKWL